jgi:hypothetical protein
MAAGATLPFEAREGDMGELLRSWLYFWKWPARRRCHGSIRCCQYLDKATDNQKRRP